MFQFKKNKNTDSFFGKSARKQAESDKTDVDLGIGQSTRQKRAMNAMLAIVIGGVVFVSVLIIFFAVKIVNSTRVNDNSNVREYKYHIAMIGSHTDAAFIRQVFEGAQSVSDENDAVVELLMPATGADDSHIQTRIDYAACTGVTGIIAYLDDEKTEISVPVGSNGNKIPIITLGNDNINIVKISHIGANQYEVGKKLASTVLDLNGNKGNVLVVVNNGQNNSSKNRLLASMQELLGQYPLLHVTIFETQYYGSIGVEDAIRDKIRSMIQPDVIICLSTEDTVRVSQTVIDLNMTGKTKIIGFNEDETTLAYLQKGVVSAIISLSPREFGEKSVKALLDYIREGYINEYITTDIKVLTKESLEQQEVEK